MRSISAFVTFAIAAGGVAVAVAGATFTARAQEDAAAEQAKTMADVRALLAESDTYAVAEMLQRDGAPGVVVQRYIGVVDGLYWTAKDLQGCMAVGRAALLFTLTRSAEAEDEDARRRLRVAAQQLSFNLASYAWPGWEEKGIEIGAAELEAGLDCARLDLRLVREMGYPPEKHANAHWIVGAQLLAAGRHADAVAEFEASREKAREAKDATKEWMADGYAGIAAALLTPDDHSGRKQVAAAKAALLKIGSDESKFLAAQLEDVLRVFSGK